ncbi:serine carboxypeptidase S28 family protein [Artemisia annua]|uniref:Serine carboxypeptidase S28 family protein n=1 Tax=Artemisia annua TaxID=35608 RepID=A0A2U1Q514_ARTAN|nr:serine carboxypeptidase S28 family protein [Artemisia annua]
MKLVFLWLLLFVFTFSATTFGALNKTPRLSLINRSLKDPNAVSATVSKDLQVFFYNQTLDHFNFNPESYATFPQRYFINFKWWGGAKTHAPIIVYLGAEGPIDRDIEILGFFTENAPGFNALLVYIEHRFYGESNPVESSGDPDSVEAMAKSVKNETLRGYFNSAQALADYAEILVHLKKKLHAHKSPIIVVGGSYGGMLASWFRLKYPHIALGALASSAPILYFNNLTPQDGYYSIVTKDFKEASVNCYNTIKKSWNEIDRVASMPEGLAILSQKFKTCSPLKDSFELTDFLNSMYAGAAQYNAPPKYPTTRICNGIDEASNAPDILDRIFAGVVAYQPNKTCYNMTSEVSQTSIGWQWQVCSEMVIPIGITSNVSMFPSSPYNVQEFIDDCKKMVLEDISNSILAVKTTEGSHCLDILNSKKTDPDWLIKQRTEEVNIISRWLRKYYRNLGVSKE